MVDAVDGLWVVVVAAGRGVRLGAGPAKQYRWLAGKPLLAHTLARVRSAAPAGIVVVTPAGDEGFVKREIVQAYDLGPCRYAAGGADRQSSVLAGLRAVPEQVEWVAVHDAARPLAGAAAFAAVWDRAAACGAAVAAAPVPDTLRRGDGASPLAAGEVERTGLWAAQTPQIARRGRLIEALERAAADGVQATDEAAALTRLGDAVALVDIQTPNPKLTRPSDLPLLEALLGGGVGARIGFGYDVHRLVPGRPLILGGVQFAHERGLEGHSDADVLCHAIMDALLGAAALGDIGEHFPNTDARYAGADSLELLRTVTGLLAAAGMAILNVDATLVAERPKLMPHAAAMRANLAEAMGIPASAVGLKATTNERLGFAGREEGI
ncbi:MAG TPA: 2-C-methyl-D-erythritol 2,4-cyclodiphosphate synthase, partial [Limnochordia bacterium]|nr:2-C-methyl-D-erythritol 2,4-cyclodiphosphate synthase [Limnochordia bacterium]